ncbi:MAG: endonuclease/exonuclease/phosphatase family protein, partial [Candidatus Ornithospirochaeta sp.]
RRETILAILCVSFLLASCSPSVEKDTFSVASWNMYQFFDGRDDGTEMEGWRKGEWSTEKYRKRIRATVEYMVKNLNDADVMIVEEVESNDVLESLLEGGLRREGYLYYGLAQSEDGKLSVGFLSRLKPVAVRLLGVPSARPMVELEVTAGGENVKIIGVHLRSRLSNENKEIRKEELSLIKKIASETEGPLIVMGDFNVDPLLHKGEMEEGRWGSSEGTVLTLTGDGFQAKCGVLYSPYLDYASPLEGGTYHYEGQWEKLDNVLLSSSFFDGDGIEYLETRIVKGSGSSDHIGRPLPYDKESGLGFSDHFAIMSTFSI